MMVLTFVLSQCFIVKLLTKPILLQNNQLSKKYLYSFRALFVLYLVQLDNNAIY